ncbi:hypothetical protein BH23CHL7_BH23CHL7_03220 [soil metagenome]
MAGPSVLIFHRSASADDARLVRVLAEVRLRVGEMQAALFRRAGAGAVTIIPGTDIPFGSQLAQVAPSRGGVIVMGSGAVPRLGLADARRLVEAAGAGGSRALTNNRYSSDVCAVGRARVLRDLPPLPGDNALPRWLEEHAGFRVDELAARERLALDIDTPLDVALWVLAPGAPAWVRGVVASQAIEVPRLDELRALARDPYAELLVFGRAGSDTLRWLERHVRCRVRFLAEERGLRASTPLAIAGSATVPVRPPRATIGRLLSDRGPAALAEVIGELADGAIIDSRVLLADQFSADERDWPSPSDRFASDLLRVGEVGDPWLRALTESASASAGPIVLGSHTLVGPGVRLLLGGRA